MRLLRRVPGGDFELVSFDDKSPPPYAILSHTWTENQEVTFDELVAGTGKDKTGYAKICFCSKQAALDDLEFFWVDTCCINKSTSQELSTAINSMFRWYQRATKCYAFLSDVVIPHEIADADAEASRPTWEDAFRSSRWFTRGWTLQELIAPSCVEFFSHDGKRLGSRISLGQEISEITKIPIRALQGHLEEFSIEERLTWAANRTTTLIEDKVYCLLGIFGIFLPLIYGEGEAYATLRLRDEIERRQKGQGTERLHDLSVSSSLPFPRNERFVGREEQLRCLERSLLSSDTHRRMIIYGLGGSGKSTLALEFAYRALAHRSLVFWVPAISQESFERAYRDIGVRLRIPGVSDDDADIKKLVKDALSSRSLGKWLMIVDNADDSAVLLGTANANPTPASLKDCLPHSDSGTILFTTRNRKVAGDLMLSNVLELSDMSKAEASQLLARWLAKQALLDDRTAVDQLLKLLTYLPLAIVQAAAFINNNDITISGYVSLFQQSGAEVELFNEQFEDPLKYREMNNTVARTWHISFDHLHRHDQLATHYLSFMACINRTDIPQSLLPSGDSTLVQQVKALGTLAGYAFITERQQPVQDLNRERFFDMHRLVHMASAWWLEGQHERATWMGRTVTRLHDVIPRGGHEGMRTWSAYLSHAVYVARLIEDQTAGASLLDRVGRCQVSLGQYSAAESTHRQALSLREKSLGKEHSQTIMSINEVALALHVSGKYKEAEVMHRQSQALTVKVRGPKHRESLVSTSNLAAVLNSQGKYEEAEAMNRQTLMQREVVLGREHPDTIMSLSALAVVLTNQGKYEEAEAMNRQTLAQQVNLLGLEHPHTLRTMANLAGTLSYLHKYGEAEALLRQTLALKTKILGREHPHTLVSVHSLANILSNLHRHDESMILYRRAIAWYAVVLGNEHPTTITCIQHYYTALALQEQDQRTESQSASDSSAPARKTKESRLVRGLAKMGIKGSIFSAG